MKTASHERLDAGFTLVEMLIVLAVIGMLALFTFPSMHSRKPSISTEVASALIHLAGLARLNAISAHEPQVMTVDMSQRQVSSTASMRVVLIPPDIKLTALSGKELVVADDKADIIFLPDGSSTGGMIELTDSRGKRFKVVINWATGVPSLEADDD